MTSDLDLDLESLGSKAREHLEKGEDLPALDIFRLLCAREAFHADWLLGLGETAARTGHLDEAVGAFGRAALVLRQQKQLEAAMEACDLGLALSPAGAWRNSLERLRHSLEGKSPTGGYPVVYSDDDSEGAAPGAPVPRESFMRRLDVLSETPLLAGLPPAMLGSLLSALEVQGHRTGAILCREGEGGDTLFLVTAGLVQVSRHRRRFGNFGGSSGPVGTVLADLGPGSVVGEMAIFTNEPRSATVVCIEPSEVLVMTREQAYGLAERFPELLERARDAMVERLVSMVLRTSPLFGAIPHDDRQELVSCFELRRVEAGEEAVVQGDPADALQVVLTGELEVTQVDKGEPIASLTMGDVFGEVSMLAEGPAIATVRALRTCWTLALPRDRFARVLAPRPALETFLRRLGESRRAADLPLDAHGALSVCWL